MEYTIRHLGFFQGVAFGDDDFLLRDKKQLEAFAKHYKEKIGLPFVFCVSANTFRKEKLEIFLDAGLKIIQMGVQSGSQRVIDEVSNRNIKVVKTKEAIHQLLPYCKKYDLKVMLDFIIDNPYETKDDIIQTYKYIIDLLSRWVKFSVFVLVFFPGSPIYERAVKDGIIDSSFEKIVRFFGSRSKIQYQKNYETALVLFAAQVLNRRPRIRRYIPKFVLRVLGSRPARKIASILPPNFLLRIVQ